jgi:hypothetical protein
MSLHQILGVLVLSLIVIGGAIAWHYAPSSDGPSPTQDDEPDDREASGADEQYPDDLAADADRERELRAIADEHGLTLISPVGLMTAEDILTLRLNLAELVDHFADRFNRIVDDFAPGWWEETAAVPMPDFDAVHALIDDTSEYAVVTA